MIWVLLLLLCQFSVHPKMSDLVYGGMKMEDNSVVVSVQEMHHSSQTEVNQVPLCYSVSIYLNVF